MKVPQLWEATATADGIGISFRELAGPVYRIELVLDDETGEPLLTRGDVEELIAAGADKVYVVDDATLAEFQSDAFVPAAEKVCREANPSIVLLGQTDVGRDLAPRLAFRLETAVAMDCLDLAISDGRLVMTRPCYGGNANARSSEN